MVPAVLADLIEVADVLAIHRVTADVRVAGRGVGRHYAGEAIGLAAHMDEEDEPAPVVAEEHHVMELERLEESTRAFDSA